jgi:hypothetical protein
MPRGNAPSKKDGNQKLIEDTFSQCGWSVSDTHAVGTRLLTNGRAIGALDLFVSKYGMTILIECKMNKGKLNPAESVFYEAWQGEKIIARDVQQALDECELIVRKHIPY